MTVYARSSFARSVRHSLGHGGRPTVSHRGMSDEFFARPGNRIRLTSGPRARDAFSLLGSRDSLRYLRFGFPVPNTSCLVHCSSLFCNRYGWATSGSWRDFAWILEENKRMRPRNENRPCRVILNVGTYCSRAPVHEYYVLFVHRGWITIFNTEVLTFDWSTTRSCTGYFYIQVVTFLGRKPLFSTSAYLNEIFYGRLMSERLISIRINNRKIRNNVFIANMII